MWTQLAERVAIIKVESRTVKSQDLAAKRHKKHKIVPQFEPGTIFICAFCAFSRLNPEEALDGGEDSGRGVTAGGGVVCLGGETLAAFGHDETE